MTSAIHPLSDDFKMIGSDAVKDDSAAAATGWGSLTAAVRRIELLSSMSPTTFINGPPSDPSGLSQSLSAGGVDVKTNCWSALCVSASSKSLSSGLMCCDDLISIPWEFEMPRLSNDGSRKFLAEALTSGGLRGAAIDGSTWFDIADGFGCGSGIDGTKSDGVVKLDCDSVQAN